MTAGQKSNNLQFVGVLEAFYGAFHIIIRRMNRRHGDEKGRTGLVFGTFLILFGQTLLMATLNQKREHMVALLFMKAVLCVFSMIFCLYVMESKRTTWIVTGSLLVYTFLGIPFCALFHQWGSKGSARKLGELSEAERAAAAPLSAAPPSYNPPPSYGGGMPPGSGYPGGPPQPQGWGHHPVTHY
mmetsp:Transcript_20623/g.36701  ORF Transcript_20623/g.36701 Transcript_20623/m.36701 type:complete len:185 (-) Transcript_20623:81-635(-)